MNATVSSHPAHPAGRHARVLLTSVFGPYARDDEWGSRRVNPMELYHNQVTRTQGVFSLRMFHRSWGLMFIQANVDAPCNLLDFPTRERFVQEIATVPYDVVGISAILPNLRKVEEMCRLVRQHQPRATIVIGGHIANRPGLRETVGADFVVRGEGVAWMRRFLGDDPARPLRHPVIRSAFGARALGVSIGSETAATVVPSVGCPMGCNFCSTSAMFGGKGRFQDLFGSGDELFEVMCGLERELRTRSFFVMDENFLLHRKRALRLLELMRRERRSWSLYVFSSARTLGLYSVDELLGLGISWLWLGLEGRRSDYVKLRDTDTVELVGRLRASGIRVLGSSIIGLPEHAPETIDAVIDDAIEHDTEFHQFMLYTPLPGTPLHDEHAAAGTLLPETDVEPADVHGQDRFNFVHPRIPKGAETGMLLRAFERDFDVNGPSVIRVARTLLNGWQRHRDHPDGRVRDRIRRECRELPTSYAAAAWAAERWLSERGSPRAAARARDVRRGIEDAFGWPARIVARVGGRVVLAAMRREQARLDASVGSEPPTFYETNREGLGAAGHPRAVTCRFVEPAGVMA